MGESWVRNADKLDALLLPFVEKLLERAALVESEYVLDIGCGAGALTLKAAAIVGPERGVVGVDVSAPLVKVAQRRAKRAGLSASFVVDDASRFRAEKPLDSALSRFGVMFFADPVGTFASLRRNLRPEGRIDFVCWAPLSENPWATVGLEAAGALLPESTLAPHTGMPGPFSMADPDHIRAVLLSAGWRGVEIDSFKPELELPGDTLPEIAEFLTEMGPAARMLGTAQRDLNDLQAEICERLSKFSAVGTRLKLPSSTWIVSATAS